jgi:hypothetical protein
MWADESYFHPRLHNSVPRLLIDDQLSFFRLCRCNMLAVLYPDILMANESRTWRARPRAPPSPTLTQLDLGGPTLLELFFYALSCSVSCRLASPHFGLLDRCDVVCTVCCRSGFIYKAGSLALCLKNMLAVPHASNNTTFLSFDPTHAHDDQTAECGINRPILPIDPELSSSLQTRELSPTCDRLHTCSFGIRPVGEPWSNSRRLDVDDLLCMVATVPVSELIEAQLRSCIPRRWAACAVESATPVDRNSGECCLCVAGFDISICYFHSRRIAWLARSRNLFHGNFYWISRGII